MSRADFLKWDTRLCQSWGFSTFSGIPSKVTGNFIPHGLWSEHATLPWPFFWPGSSAWFLSPEWRLLLDSLAAYFTPIHPEQSWAKNRTSSSQLGLISTTKNPPHILALCSFSQFYEEEIENSSISWENSTDWPGLSISCRSIQLWLGHRLPAVWVWPPDLYTMGKAVHMSSHGQCWHGHCGYHKWCINF